MLKTVFVKTTETLPVNVEAPLNYIGIEKTLVFQRDDEETIPGEDVFSIRDESGVNVLYSMNSSVLTASTKDNWQSEDISFSEKPTNPTIEVDGKSWFEALTELGYI